jgi:signal transduction histidine kinase
MDRCEDILIFKDSCWYFDKFRYEKLEISANIVDTIVRRIARLETDERTLLSIASLLGRQFDIDILFAVSLIPQERIIASIDRAIDLHFIERDFRNRRQFVFVHDRIRKVFNTIMGRDTMKRYTLHIAESLEKKYKNNPEPVIFTVAQAYINAEKNKKILEYSFPAAEAALRRFAFVDAHNYLNTALQILEYRGDRGTPLWGKAIMGLIDIDLVIGRNDDAIALSEKALTCVDTDGKRAEIYMRITEAYYKKAELPVCEQNAVRGLKLVGETPPVKKGAVLCAILKEFFIHILQKIIPHTLLYRKNVIYKHIDLIYRYYYALTNAYAFYDTVKMMRNIIHVLNLANSCKNRNTPQMAMGFMAYGILCLEAYRFKAALAYITRGLHLAEKLKDRWHTGKALYFLAIYYDTVGEYEKAIECCKRSCSLFEEIGDNNELLLSYTILSHNYIKLGKYGEIERMHRFDKIDNRTKDSFFESGLYYLYLYGYTRKGEYEKAEYYGIQALAISKKYSIWLTYCPAHIDLGILYCEQGEYEKAQYHLEEALRVLKNIPLMKQYTYYVYTAYADVLISLYEKKEYLLSGEEKKWELKRAGRACRQAVNKTRLLVSHYGGALRVTAKFYALCSNSKKAVKLFLQSIAHCNTYRLRYEQAKTMCEYGYFLQHTGNRGASADMYEKAYHVFKTIGSAGYEKLLKQHLTHFENKNVTLRLMDRERLSSIIKVNHDISSLLSIDSLLENIINHAMEISGAQRTALFILNNEKDILEIRAEKNISKRVTHRYPVHLINNAFRTRRIFPSSENHVMNLSETNLKSILCIPLIHRDNAIGVLYLDNPEAAHVFLQEDVELVQVFTTQAAIAIENAELFRKTVNLVDQIQRLNEEKEEQRKQLVQADKMISLGILTSGIAHDIATPLGAIAANIRFIANYSPELLELLDELCTPKKQISIRNLSLPVFREKFQQGIEGIQTCVENMKGILETLRSFYKKDVLLIEEDVDINKVVTDSIPLLSHEFSRTGCEPVLKLTKSLPPVRGNFQSLQQVLINLLINACHAVMKKEYNKNEKKHIILETCCESYGKVVIVKVKDNGTGMEDRVLAKITQPFFTTRHSDGGTGLGLHITHKIIEEHKGIISIYSKINEGTIVTITLPQKGKKSYE